MKLPRKHSVTAGKFSMAAMSDMAFLLIIFFMVCAKFVDKSDVKVSLPRAVTAEKAEEGPIVVSITAEKLVYVNAVDISISDILPELRGQLRAASTPDQKTVIIRADRSLKYKDIRPIVDAVDRAGGMLELAVLGE